jgi:REP element-mobilizing transposase RayT
MKTEYSFHATQFFTATIYEWQPVLADDKFKEIVIESLRFLVAEKRIELNAFVIMRNHIHLIWQALNDNTPSDIQASFMKYTAQQIKRLLQKNNSIMLASFK